MDNLYEQRLSEAREVIVAGRLMIAGYIVSRPLSGATRYDLVAEKDGKFIKIQVKSLKLDGTYKNDKGKEVFKIEGYSFNPKSEEKNVYTSDEIDVIIGYNHVFDYYAALPISEFKDKQSCVVHAEKGRLRNEYMNNLKAFDDIFLKDIENSYYAIKLENGEYLDIVQDSNEYLTLYSQKSITNGNLYYTYEDATKEIEDIKNGSNEHFEYNDLTNSKSSKIVRVKISIEEVSEI